MRKKQSYRGQSLIAPLRVALRQLISVIANFPDERAKALLGRNLAILTAPSRAWDMFEVSHGTDSVAMGGTSSGSSNCGVGEGPSEQNTNKRAQKRINNVC